MNSVQKALSSYKTSTSLDKQKSSLDKYDRAEDFGAGSSSGRKDSFDKILDEKLKKSAAKNRMF